MPVQDASCFSDNGDYTISGKFAYSRVDYDQSDILFGIHDGSSVIGIRRNKGIQLWYGNKGTWDVKKTQSVWGHYLPGQQLLARNSSDMTVMFDIAFSAGDDKGTVTVTNTAGEVVTFSKLMNRLSFSSSISFFLAANNRGESYEVRSIEISAPCPARTKVHIQGPGNLYFF